MSNDFDLKNVIIRNIRKEDFDQIVEIDSLAIGYPRNPYFDKKFRRMFGDDSGLMLALVAEYNKKIIGFIMGEANNGEYGIAEPVASVDTLGLDPDFTRSGVGKLLIEDFCTIAEKAGISLMTTLVASAWPEIIEFFKAHGFKPAGMLALDRKLNPQSQYEG